MARSPIIEPLFGREAFEPSLPLSPRDLDHANGWLVSFRWLAAVLVPALTALATLLEVTLPEAPLYGLGLAILAYNVAFLRLVRRSPPAEAQARLTRTRRLLFAQIGLDWLSIGTFLHLTGGITSPGVLLFAIHMLTVATLLPRPSPYLSVAVGTGLLGLLAALEYAGALPHHRVLPALPPGLHRDAEFLGAQVGFFVLATFAAVHLASLVVRRLRERDRQLGALVQAADAISSSLELEEVLRQLAESAARAFSAPGAAIRLLDRAGERLSLAASHGLSERYFRKGEIELAKSHIDREVLLSGAPSIVADVGRDQRVQYPRELMAEGIASILVAPLTGRAGPVGVLRVYGERPRQFENADLTLAAALGGQGGAALQHALAHQELQRLEEARGVFVRTVTHELRSPLSSAQMMLGVLLDGTAGSLTPEQQGMLDRVKARVDSLQLLVADLLALAESRSAELQEKPVEVDLAGLVRRLVEQAEPEARAKGIELAREIPPGPLEILATARGLTHVFGNLLSNALKYTPAGGRVEVRVARDGPRVSVAVRDTGMGIPAADLPKLWGEFFRAQNARKSGIAGTGLGLSIVKRMVEAFEGQIGVQSAEGQGTTFVVSFRLAGSGEGRAAGA